MTIATLPNVAPGAYLVFAKTTIVQSTGDSGASAFARCTLNGDPTTNTATDDYAETEVGRGLAGEVGRATLATHVTTTLATTGSFALRCRRLDNSGPSDPVVVRETKIIAVKLNRATRTAVSG